MNISTYKSVLQFELAKLHKPWKDGNEGLVYVGLIKPNRSEFSKNDFYSFCYLLSFFVAFDLLVYAHHQSYYPHIKQKLQIPKFEFGLTHTYYYPSVIWERTLGSIQKEIFESSFDTFIEHLKEQDLEIDYKVVLRNCFTDKDFTNGFYNKCFIESLERHQIMQK